MAVVAAVVVFVRVDRKNAAQLDRQSQGPASSR